jgi:hypothetical protein
VGLGGLLLRLLDEVVQLFVRRLLVESIVAVVEGDGVVEP